MVTLECPAASRTRTMAAKGLWQSPDGKTSKRTLYPAISREITKKCRAARFKKAGKGKFWLRGEG